MGSLNAKQRAYLKSLAHPLKPILQIGKEGASEAAAQAVEGAFNTREILKVKVLETAPENARDTADALMELIEGVQVVQVIGRTVVLYRPHPDTPKIALPR